MPTHRAPRAAFVASVAIAFAAGAWSITAHASAVPSPVPDALNAALSAPDVPAPLASALRARTTPMRVSSSAGSDGTWQLVAPPAGVPRYEPAIVFDPLRQRLVVFGGAADDSVVSDTWTFTLATGVWARLTTAGTPPPQRRLHGAVYDPSGDRMVIVGGWNHGLLSDAWQLSFNGTPTWSPIAAGGSPGGRANFACAYDAANDRLVMFGGYDGVSEPFGRSNQVWTLSLGASPAWTQIVPSGTGPGARMGMTSGWSESGHRLFVYGGSDSLLHSDLWKLQLGASPAWSLVADEDAGPQSRSQAVGGFDPVSGKFAVSTGYDHDFLYADLWTIAPNSATPEWQDVTPDPTIRARWGASGLVTPSGMLILTGGVNPRYRLEADTWTINVANPTGWTAIGDAYPYRMQELMVMDPTRHRFIAFGGTDGQYRNDTYTHTLDSGRGWEPLATAGTPPGPRRLHAGIYDPIGDRLIVFGGYDDHAFGDLWQLTLSGTPTWSLMTADGTPPSPRAGHLAVYDPVGHRMIIGMGWDGVTPPGLCTGTAYALSLDGTPTWSQLPDGPPIASTVGVYDDATHSILVFGGGDGVSLHDETWRLSLSGTPAWSQVPASGPIPREEESAVYDTKRDRMVIFGGYDVPSPNYHMMDDLWSLDGTASTPLWRTLSPEGTAPIARWGQKALYDPELDGMWMYGGWTDGYSRDLFFLQWSDASTPALATTTSAQFNGTQAQIQWALPGQVRSTVTIERSADGVNWQTVGDILSSGTTCAFTDNRVPAGPSFAYRLSVLNGGTLMSSQPVWVTRPTVVEPEPAVRFGLSNGRAVSLGSLSVLCSLPQRAPGRVELLDVSGRLRDSRDVSELGTGTHTITLGRGLAAGMYFVKLTSGGRTASVKGIVLR